MTCGEVREAFSDLYDASLSGPPLAAVSRHLETCPACRAEWAAFRGAVRALAALGSADPSPGFATRVRQQIQEPPWWRRVLRGLFLPLHVKVPLHALAVVLVAFAGLLLYQRSPELRRETEPRMPSPPPAAREAPFPGAPAPKAPDAFRATKETPREIQAPASRADSLKAKRAEPQAAPSGPVPSMPEARLEKEKERGPSPTPEEGRKQEGTAVPPGQAQLGEASREPRPEAPEPGMAARRLLRSPLPPAQAPAPSVGAAQPMIEGRALSTPSADELYSAALADMARQRYDQAIDGYRAFITQHPRDRRVPDARLRLAEVYSAQQRYAEAILEYEALARQFPDSPLIPTALLRLAQARLALGDQAGCTLLRDLTNQYPESTEAAQAREVLSTRCP